MYIFLPVILSVYRLLETLVNSTPSSTSRTLPPPLPPLPPSPNDVLNGHRLAPFSSLIPLLTKPLTELADPIPVQPTSHLAPSLHVVRDHRDLLTTYAASPSEQHANFSSDNRLHNILATCKRRKNVRSASSSHSTPFFQHTPWCSQV
jgi:hypothetical protein